MRNVYVRGILFLLLVAAAAVYAGSLRSGWHLDDNHTIVRNEKIADIRGAIGGALTANRGIADLTLAVNWFLSGADPLAYHVVNLIIHLANGILVFLLARKLGADRKLSDLTAIGTAGLFLLHPLATNSVTYIVQRYTSLAALFYLASVWLFLRGREGWRAGAILSVVTAVLAARTKEIALTLPLALLLVDRGEGERVWRRFARVLPHAIAVSLIPITLVTARIGLGESLSEALGRGSRETGEIDRVPYLLTQVHVVTTYLRLLAAPYGLTLDHDYPITRAVDPVTVCKGLFLAALGIAALRSRRWEDRIPLGVAWFFLALLVESTVFPIRDVIFEHRTYLPSFGFFLAVVTLLGRMVRSPRLLLAVLTFLFVALGILTFERNRIWADEVTLWTDCVAKAPRKARAHANLGYAWIDAGENEKAIQSLETAIRIGPPFPEDLVTLAGLYHENQDEARAEATLRRAIKIRPDYGRARRNLAQLLADRGDWEGALEQAEEATRRDPDYASGWAMLARVRLEAGDAEGSILAAEEAATRGGDRGEIALLAARAAAAVGDAPRALRELIAWGEGGGHGNEEDAARLVRALVEADFSEEALRAARLAAAALPHDPRFRYYEGVLHLEAGRPADAAASFREALRVDPGEPSVRALLARSLLEARRPEEARLEAMEALRIDPGENEAARVLQELESRR